MILYYIKLKAILKSCFVNYITPTPIPTPELQHVPAGPQPIFGLEWACADWVQP
jgi:hypothetical protein